MTGTAFPDLPRVDAREKVRGATLYAADDARPMLLHGALATATIPRGVVKSLDTAAAAAVPGVRLVMTHQNLGVVRPAGFAGSGGYGFQSVQALAGDRIAHFGQAIALVVAETLETAREAASLVRASYAAEPHSPTIDAPGVEIVAQAESALPKPRFEDAIAGDADAAFAGAEVKVDATYTSAKQHHNPLELVATVAEWQGGTLTIHEGSQSTGAIRGGLARSLGISPQRVQVLSPTTGGGFGQKGALQAHTLLAAIAAQRTGRPVKLVTSRHQLFHSASFRPASRHRIRLGAGRDGRMTALIHESDAQTSRHDLFGSLHLEVSARLHGIPNIRGRERLVRTDVQTPGYMRAPFEHPSSFAMESAVDELAYALGQDPVALRLANDATRDALTGKPLSSRHLDECLRRGAARFGWARRSMAPGSMRNGDGTLVGWGVAAGAYKTATVPAVVALRLTADGSVAVAIGMHEMGQGIRNAIVAALSRRLGVAPERVTVSLGDTRAVPQHTTAGSWGATSAVPAVEEAADALLRGLAEIAPNAAGAAPAEMLRSAGRPSFEVSTRRKAPGQPDAVFERLEAGLVAAAGPEYPDFVSLSYIAHFVEVRVEPTTRRVRVPRVVSVADCGRVVSPRTAASQVRGGVVWGVSAALREGAEVDPRYGSVVNADLADYVIPVNADIGAIEVDFVDRPDPLANASGVKGLGEVAMVGVAAAVANAIHHATGRRLRDLPIRIEHIL
ncbi:xanthine dehydrogenase family protein molybdopterin-binding subunit [Methylobacterium oryzisoli]|uniref:xanthine dehydrogenase family protein molybdopterin-binding subunit n=1 Tax=Methylobacterium oryzisoli TaxID=3385502 RepID=UPI0038919BB9